VIAKGADRGTVERHALLRQIAGEPVPQPAGKWLRYLARDAVPDVALRLGEAGYLEYAGSRVPWRQGRWVPVDPDWAFSPMLRVRSALDPARPVTPYGAVLTGLAVASGLGFRLDQYQARAGRSVQDVVALLGLGLQELIAQTQTAVDSAVLSLAGTEGAKVRASLTARAAAIRARQLSDAETAAQAATERMSLPLVLLFAGFLLLIGYPAVIHVLTGI
jgi:hypothetical protein